jgi:hypothetical protein
VPANPIKQARLRQLFRSLAFGADNGSKCPGDQAVCIGEKSEKKTSQHYEFSDEMYEIHIKLIQKKLYVTIWLSKLHAVDRVI